MDEPRETENATDAAKTTPAPASAAVAVGEGRVLGRLTTTLPPAGVAEKLNKLSKRGKLPGFERPSGAVFGVTLFGQPFDQNLLAYEDAGGLRLERTWKLRTPMFMVVLLLISFEPGATLLKSFLPASFGWFQSHLRWWYYPLMILQIPLVWRMFPKSKAAALEHARETIAKISAEVDGTFEAHKEAPRA
ncbi:MAG: hypothetical protein AAF138_06600 [Planctomycetota bacterium]